MSGLLRERQALGLVPAAPVFPGPLKDVQVTVLRGLLADLLASDATVPQGPLEHVKMPTPQLLHMSSSSSR